MQTYNKDFVELVKFLCCKDLHISKWDKDLRDFLLGLGGV